MLETAQSVVVTAQRGLSNCAAAHARSLEGTLDTGYSKSTSVFGVYIPKVSTSPVGMSLTRTAWVKLNRLRTGVGRFSLSMHKWGLASSSHCECGVSENTVDHIILTCPAHRTPRKMLGMTDLDGVIRYWLNSITARI